MAVDPLVILSPHLDDAVLSLGQLIAGRTDVVVVTVFAGIPKDGTATSTDYDRRSGFTDSRRAVIGRRAEDAAALAVLGADAYYMPHPDNQYDDPARPDVAGLTVDIGRVLAELRPSAVAMPLGLAHADHHLLADACRTLARVTGGVRSWWVYEDVPSRVLWPEQVPAQMETWRAAGFRLTLDFFGTGPLDQKERALACYRSQAWALDIVHNCLVPERLWRLTT